MNFIDQFLNGITMYRVVLYSLCCTALIAFIQSALGTGTFPFSQLVVSLVILSVSCQAINWLLGKVYRVPTNYESATITALILFLILAPATNTIDAVTLVLAAVIAMASKYILSINGRHLFNPAAIALVILTFAGSTSAFWWVGSASLLPVVTITGLLVVRKTRREALFLAFLVTTLLGVAFVALQNGGSIPEKLVESFLSWPLLFFATIMVTEPLTTPPTRSLQICYGILVGMIFSSQIHGPYFSTTPEISLIIGNIYSYMISNKQRLRLALKTNKVIAQHIHDLSFSSPQKLQFQPGQYMEWTLATHRNDTRGNRRYFTIASSPTETEVHLGIKAYPQGSGFKESLLAMKPGDIILASHIAGEFTLPQDPKQKIVMIAGGIGVTPFRSMIKYLSDTEDKRDVILIYAANNENEFAYQEIFAEAKTKISLETHYVVTESTNISKGWKGKVGRITTETLQELVPDYDQRVFYISGPGGMVEAYKKMLHSLQVPGSKIKTDFFPGF